QIGHELLAGSGEALPELAATITWTHHERVDGTGYPRGLRGDKIPLEGRIAAVGDVFDALTHDRVYRPAMGADEAVDRPGRASGRRSTTTAIGCCWCTTAPAWTATAARSCSRCSWWSAAATSSRCTTTPPPSSTSCGPTSSSGRRPTSRS